MKSSQFTETQIIDGLKSNDSRVFDYLFNEYYTQLQYFAERLVSNREEAQDIVEDFADVIGVFLRSIGRFVR